MISILVVGLTVVFGIIYDPDGKNVLNHKKDIECHIYDTSQVCLIQCSCFWCGMKNMSTGDCYARYNSQDCLGDSRFIIDDIPQSCIDQISKQTENSLFLGYLVLILAIVCYVSCCTVCVFEIEQEKKKKEQNNPTGILLTELTP